MEPVRPRGRALVRLRFSPDRYHEDVEFRLYVDEDVDLTLVQVELRPLVR